MLAQSFRQIQNFWDSQITDSAAENITDSICVFIAQHQEVLFFLHFSRYPYLGLYHMELQYICISIRIAYVYIYVYISHKRIPVHYGLYAKNFKCIHFNSTLNIITFTESIQMYINTFLKKQKCTNSYYIVFRPM